MDYLLYEAEDFAADESYLRYYFKLNEADVIFWQDWISNHPERLDIVVNGEQLINFLYFQLPKEELEQEFNRIKEAVDHSEAIQNPVLSIQETAHDVNDFPSSRDTSKVRRLTGFAGSTFSRWMLAASVLMLFPIAGNYFFRSNKHLTQKVSEGNGWISKVNNTTRAEHLQLPDGSIVTLQPGASLTFPKQFAKDKREVYLEGEAFFQVTKDAQHSFYVYYNNLVTHVLGTSFNVRIDKQTHQVEVAVRTGRVEVYEKTEDVQSSVNKNNTGVILTPNQKVVYSEESKRFDASIVDVPLPIELNNIKSPARDSVMVSSTFLNQVPFGEIIESFKTLYGIEIVVEDENMYKCHFSGDISDLNLYVKLDIICQALNASYEKKGMKIIVRGKGCNN